MLIPEGDLYVSAVEGHLVARFGSARGDTKGIQIGAYPETEMTPSWHNVFKGMRWDLEEVVRIPRSSYVPFLKEYDAAISSGELKQRTKAEFEAYESKLAADAKKAEDDAKAAKAEADAAEAKAKAEADAAAKKEQAAAKAGKKE